MFRCAEDIALEMARIEREALRVVLDKIVARQLGEAFKLEESTDARA